MSHTSSDPSVGLSGDVASGGWVGVLRRLCFGSVGGRGGPRGVLESLGLLGSKLPLGLHIAMCAVVRALAACAEPLIVMFGSSYVLAPGRAAHSAGWCC